jgi:hypothetical protein
MINKKVTTDSICDVKFPIGSIIRFIGMDDHYLIVAVYNYMRNAHGYEIESFDTGKHYVLPERFLDENISV